MRKVIPFFFLPLILLIGCSTDPFEDPALKVVRDIKAELVGKSIYTRNVKTQAEGIVWFGEDGTVEIWVEDRKAPVRGTWHVNDKGVLTLSVKDGPESQRAFFRRGDQLEVYDVATNKITDKVYKTEEGRKGLYDKLTKDPELQQIPAAELKAMVAGKTLYLRNEERMSEVVAWCGKDGTIEVLVEGQVEPVVRGSWSVDDRGIFTHRTKGGTDYMRAFFRKDDKIYLHDITSFENPDTLYKVEEGKSGFFARFFDDPQLRQMPGAEIEAMIEGKTGYGESPDGQTRYRAYFSKDRKMKAVLLEKEMKVEAVWSIEKENVLTLRLSKPVTGKTVESIFFKKGEETREYDLPSYEHKVTWEKFVKGDQIR